MPRLVVTDEIGKPCPDEHHFTQWAERGTCDECADSGSVLPEFVVGGASQLLVPGDCFYCDCPAAACNREQRKCCPDCQHLAGPVSAGSTLTDIPLWRRFPTLDGDALMGPLGVVAGTVYAIDKAVVRQRSQDMELSQVRVFTEGIHEALVNAAVFDVVQAVPEDVVVIATRLERTTT